MKLINMPLEPLENRYGEQWSRWSQEVFGNYFGEVVTVDGNSLTDSIEVGKILDANGTVYWKMHQMAKISKMFHDGEVLDGDVFFFHDLQFLGWENIKYMAELNGVDVKVFGFLHASSWTEGDFSQPMAPWLAPYEVAWINAADGVFVGSQYHKERIVLTRQLPTEVASKIYVCGNPIDITEYRSQASENVKDRSRIVWPHRFHHEKNPHFMVDVISWMAIHTDAKAWFHVRSPIAYKDHQDGIHKVSPADLQLLVDRLDALNGHPNIMVSWLRPVSKPDYYHALSEATVVWSTSLEESFGYCNVEGIALGCHPVLPRCAAHREVVRDKDRYMYECAEKLIAALEKPSPPTIYIEPYEESFDRMAQIMEGA
jgi:glycosyltransferase involved in cell wall biosynthesis